MIKRDRELLAQISRVNKHVGNVVLVLLQGQDGGGLPADSVRELGRYLHDLGATLLGYARERDGHVTCVTDGYVVHASPIDAEPPPNPGRIGLKPPPTGDQL